MGHEKKRRYSDVGEPEEMKKPSTAVDARPIPSGNSLPAPSRATDLTARTTGYIAILNTIFSQVMSWFAVKYTLKIPPEKQVQPIVVNRGLRTRLPNGSLHNLLGSFLIKDDRTRSNWPDLPDGRPIIVLNLDQGDVLETFFHELQHYKHWLLTGEPPEDGLLPDDPSEILAEKQGQVDYSAFLQEHGELVDESGGLIRLANNRKIIGELNEAR